MSAVLLVILVSSMALVIFWYVFDESARDGDGKSGFLGMGEPTKRQADPAADWHRTRQAPPWRVTRRR